MAIFYEENYCYDQFFSPEVAVILLKNRYFCPKMFFFSSLVPALAVDGGTAMVWLEVGRNKMRRTQQILVSHGF
jgi:hypothetical protein